MGQLQRDDRRRVRQETVELWEIDSERIRGSRPRSRRVLGQPQQKRQLRPVEEEYQERRSGQGRQRQQVRQPRQAEESGCRRQSRSARTQRSRAASHRHEEELQFLLPVDYPRAGNPKPVQSIKRRKARRRKIFLSRTVAVLFTLLCLALIYQAAGAAYRYIHRDVMYETMGKDEQTSTLWDKLSDTKIAPPEIEVDFLEVNEYSRPGTKLGKVKNIFVHYTANPETSARNNRSYFANLAQTHEREASAHLIIGYEGEIIQCIPFDEQAYAVRTRNGDSISIECCYLDEDGSFTQATYDTLLHTLAWLLEKYDLSTEDILRHYDCGGKKCPLYYVEHEDAWEQLLADVEAYEASVE